jgi:subtilisin family serine protease
MEEKIGEALRARLQSAQPHDTFEVDIFMAGEPAEAAQGFADAELEAADIDPAAVAGRLQEQAAVRQRGVLEYLTGFGGAESFADAEGAVSVPKVGAVQSFWINNVVAAEVTLDVLASLLERPDVIHVELARRADVGELIDGGGKSSGKSKDSKKRKAGGAATGRAARARTASESSAGDFEAYAGGRAFNLLDFVRSGSTLAAFNAPADFADAPQPTWSVKRVGAPLLWQLGLDGEDVLVAVIDTGVNYDHPDLERRMWDGGAEFPLHGYDFAADDNDPQDEGESGFGHGTACAGIVAGDGTSGTRTGVAPGARVMALRVGGLEHNFWRALEFAVEHRAHVISMSMTWKAPANPNYPGWRRVCESILTARILHANSTGNNGHLSTAGAHKVPFNIGAPGNCPPPRLHPLQANPVGGEPHLSSIISCGSTDDADRLRDNSGRGPCAWEAGPYTDFPFAGGTRPGLIKPDVCAPGSATETCDWRFDEFGKPYTTFSGTSAATPHVAGCMALLAQACRRAGTPVVPARVQEALENTAVRIQGQVRDKQNNFGAGRVDIFAAFKYGESRGWWG